MSNFYVLGQDKEAVEKFFSVLPEEKRPRVVTDKESPNAWDHQTDNPTVIVTNEPRTDTDAKELSIENKQAEDVLAEMTPEEQGAVSSEDPAAESVVEDAKKEGEAAGQSQPPAGGSFLARGFKVGRIL